MQRPGRRFGVDGRDPGGEAQSPAGKSGLAGAVAAMLTEGPGAQRDQFADALEDLGAQLNARG